METRNKKKLLALLQSKIGLQNSKLQKLV